MAAAGRPGDLEAALALLSVHELRELRSLPNPPAKVIKLELAVARLLQGSSATVDDAKRLLARPGLKEALQAFGAQLQVGQAPLENVAAAQEVCKELGEGFTQKRFETYSRAAGGLCAWVLAILRHCDGLRG